MKQRGAAAMAARSIVIPRGGYVGDVCRRPPARSQAFADRISDKQHRPRVASIATVAARGQSPAEEAVWPCV